MPLNRGTDFATSGSLESLRSREAFVFFISYALDDFLDEGVLLRSEVFLLNFFEKVMATSLGDHESFSNSATLHGDLSSIL